MPKNAESRQKHKSVLPVIPLKEMVVFPNMMTPLMVGREKTLKALDAAMRENELVMLVTQRSPEIEDPMPEDMFTVGTIAKVIQTLKLQDGTAKALVEGQSRAKITEFVQTDDYFRAEVVELKESQERRQDKVAEVEALMRNAMSQFERSIRVGKPVPPEVLVATFNINDPSRLADFITFHLNLKPQERQDILEAVNHIDRLRKVIEFLNRELEILEIGTKIQNRVKDQMDKTQKEYYLREQLKAIQKEIGGMNEEAEEAEELRERINAAGMPEQVNEKALKELERFERMPAVSAESPVIRTYLDWLINLPWSAHSEEKLDIKEAQTILDEDHYGLNQVKERILEYLAVRSLSPHMRGSILCFSGPPGTGKTSIGKSIARAMGRKFIRMSLGGVRDEAEIRGHRRTYVGAMPGRIIQSINQAKARNPVFMLDEIDKIGADFRGDPSAALLEALDPEQNYAFSDHYLEVPFDLSDVMFITTANILDTIPPALRDRMEVIRFPGYTEDEKLHIAKDYLIPKQIEEHGLSDDRIMIEDDALTEIVRRYTREAGVRNLERDIATLCRKVARDVVGGMEGREVIDMQNLTKYLGQPKFHYGTAEEHDEVGVAVGLAWTEVGGDILQVEVTTMKGKGSLVLTGQLGEVMRESAQAALSYIRSRAKQIHIDPDFYEKIDIHIHVPAGAIPKDGPSAGITIAAALASALTRIPCHKDVGMTGEITLRGKVLPVGGVKEKLLAAHRAGLKTIILPKDNIKDIDDLPGNARNELNFIPVEHMDEVIKRALVVCQPEASVLEADQQAQAVGSPIPG